MKVLNFCSIILLLALCAAIPVFGQESHQCLSFNQLRNFRSCSLQERQNLLRQNNFILVSSETNESLVWHGDSLNVSMINYRRNDGYENEFLTLYYDEGLRLIIEYMASSSCINKIRNEVISVQAFDTKHDNSNKHYTSHAYGTRLEFMPDTIASKYQRIWYYNDTDIDSIIAVTELSDKNKDKHQHDLNVQVNLNLQKADSLAQMEQYADAILLLEEVYNYSPELIPTLEERLGTYKQLLKQKNIDEYSAQADDYFKKEQYSDALVMYNKVLNEDMNNASAKDHIGIIIKRLNVINKRMKITFDYNEICPDNYAFIKTQMEQQLNRLISKLDEGLLNFNFVIDFDTFAINQSYFDIKAFSFGQSPNLIVNVRDSLLHLVSHPQLKPSYLENVAVASTSSFRIKSNWSTHEETVIKKLKRNIYKTSNTVNPDIEYALAHDSALYKGKYTFSIKDKQVNDKLYQDISITKYKTVGGEAFIYGLVPGLGTLLATQGKEGTLYMAVSLACYVGAGVAYYEYKKFEKQINDASSVMTEDELNSLKKNKDICKWSSIAGVSVGASFQLAGMIHALVRGIQNKKASRELRKALKKEPYPIVSEEAHIE